MHGTQQTVVPPVARRRPPKRGSRGSHAGTGQPRCAGCRATRHRQAAAAARHTTARRQPVQPVQPAAGRSWRNRRPARRRWCRAAHDVSPSCEPDGRNSSRRLRRRALSPMAQAIGRFHDRGNRCARRGFTLERRLQLRQRIDGMANQCLHTVVRGDRVIEHAIEHVLDLPGELSQEACTDQAAGALQRMERATDRHQRVDALRVEPATPPRAATKVVDLFFRFPRGRSRGSRRRYHRRLSGNRRTRHCRCHRLPARTSSSISTQSSSPVGAAAVTAAVSPTCACVASISASVGGSSARSKVSAKLETVSPVSTLVDGTAMCSIAALWISSSATSPSDAGASSTGTGQ